MTIKIRGQSSTEFLLSAPLVLSSGIFVIAFLYYFSYQVASQYHAYQALLCTVTASKSACEKKFLSKLSVFKGIKKEKLYMTKEESSSAIKMAIHWEDNLPLIENNIRRENSVYLPKKI